MARHAAPAALPPLLVSLLPRARGAAPPRTASGAVRASNAEPYPPPLRRVDGRRRSVLYMHISKAGGNLMNQRADYCGE
eukprot:gene5342-9718_t